MSAYDHGNLYRLRFGAVAPTENDPSILWIDTSTDPPTPKTYDTVSALWVALAVDAAPHIHAIADTTGLQAALDAKAADTDLTAHVSDAVGAHAASAIAFTPASSIIATNAQDAIVEALADAYAAVNTHSHLLGDLEDVSYGVLDDGATLRYSSSLGSWGAGVPSQPQVRCYHSATQAISSPTILQFNSERYDTDEMHHTSAANLTGTVAKAASSATLTGTGTAFTTELAVGQVISVPGTASEVRVVTSIASDTSLTVATAFANTASGQTAARVNSAIVFRTPGLYLVEFMAEIGASTSGQVAASCYKNRSDFLRIDGRPYSAGSTYQYPSYITQARFAQWDFIEARITTMGLSAGVTASLSDGSAVQYGCEFSALYQSS